MKKAMVSLVGAGVGAADLITLRGLDRIKNADCIIYDRLIDSRLLEEAPARCEKIYVGKAAGEHSMKQEEITSLLIERARRGGSVVRLKGGDPYVFGRGGEEALALRGQGLDFEVIPGISSAIAGPMFAGIPVTHRQAARSLHIITAHTKDGGLTRLDYQRLASCEGTLVFLMGLSQAGAISTGLISNGRDGKTPAAVIAHAGGPRQRTLVSTLEQLAGDIADSDITSPAIIVIGETVALRSELSFFEARPLFGRKILLTRQSALDDELYSALSDAGADVSAAPMIRIAPRPDALKDALGRLESFSHIVFTSGNAVEVFMEAVLSAGGDARCLHKAALCAVGSATAKRLSQFGLCADIMAENYSAAGLLESMRDKLSEKSRVLLPHSALAAPFLETELGKLCAVEAADIYDTLLPEGAMTEEEFAAQGFEGVVFASSSAVDNFNTLIGMKALHESSAQVFSIGPSTSGSLRKYGLEPLESAQATLADLAETIICYYEGRRK